MLDMMWALPFRHHYTQNSPHTLGSSNMSYCRSCESLNTWHISSHATETHRIKRPTSMQVTTTVNYYPHVMDMRATESKMLLCCIAKQPEASDNEERRP